MTNKSRAIAAAVVVTTCSVANAFIPRPPVGKSFSATPASSARSRVGSKASQHPQTRGDNACAVGPLNFFKLSILDIASDLVDRECEHPPPRLEHIYVRAVGCGNPYLCMRRFGFEEHCRRYAYTPVPFPPTAEVEQKQIM